MSPKTQRKLNDLVVEQISSTRVLTEQALLAHPFHKHSAAKVQMVGLSLITGVVFLIVTTSRKTVEKSVLEKEDLFAGALSSWRMRYHTIYEFYYSTFLGTPKSP